MATKIFVDGEGLSALEVIEVDEGGRLEDVVIKFAEKTGKNHEELVLFLEDEGEALDLKVVIEAHPHKAVSHHIHTQASLDVTVEYMTHAEHHSYPPSTRIQKVLEWAIAIPKFNIDSSMASEMVLSLPGNDDALKGSDHIGRYAHGKHVKFKLTRCDLHQG